MLSTTCFVSDYWLIEMEIYHDWKAFAAMQLTGHLHLALTAAFHIQNVLILYKGFVFYVTHSDPLSFTFYVFIDGM